MKSVKLNDVEIKRFMNITQNLNHQDPLAYENIRIKDNGIVFILYNSKKLVYNENSRTLELLSKILDKREYSYNQNIQSSINYNRVENNHINFNKYDYIIGSDETGKGEWYGPLVVCAVCTSNDENEELKKIGVMDSKKLNTKQIVRLYYKIKKLDINHQTLILRPFSYNKLYHKFTTEKKNLNHLLAHLHSKAIGELLKTIDSTNVLVMIDKFDYKKMNQYLNIDKKIDVIQESNAERYIPVATSSIIAKYHYEKTLKEIEERYNIRDIRKTKVENIDKEILDKIAKLHFKNVKRYI